MMQHLVDFIGMIIVVVTFIFVTVALVTWWGGKLK